MEFFKIIGWSLAGPLAGCVLTYAEVMIFYRVLGPTVDGDTRGFEDLATLMGSGMGAGVGFLVGAIYGTVRWWSRKARPQAS
jgi:hypothetical protein